MGNTRVDLSVCPSPHPLKNRIARVAWQTVWILLFRPSPVTLHGWRRFLLRLFGARIGQGAHVYSSCKIWGPWHLTMRDYSCLAPYVDCYCVAPVTIGAHSTVSQYSYLCTASHDFENPSMPLVTSRITIEDQAWVCVDVFIGPGVTVGEGAVVGARASVFSDVEPWTIVGGNPAKAIKKRDLKSV